MTLLITGKNAAADDVPEGKLFRTGRNTVGQLGDGSTTSRSSPVQIGSLTDWTAASLAFNYHQLLLRSNGTLWASGKNDKGQLGQGNTTDRSSPVQIGSLTNWSAIQSGTNAYKCSFAINSSGQLFAWGFSAAGTSEGRLGLGNSTDYSSPVQVGSLTNWKSLACGFRHSLAIKTDGTLWSWGDGYHGQLGNGSVTDISSPVQVGSLTNWSKVAVHQNNGIALKTDGTIWTWGRNAFGMLGDGTTTNRSSPVQVGGLTTWSNIGIVGYGTMASKTDGTLWAWGKNNNGQLAQGNTTNRSSPVQIGSLTNWASLSSGSGMGHAVKQDGTLWGWGYNILWDSSTGGFVGDGTTTNRSSPVQIGSSTDWAAFNLDIGHCTLGIETV